MAGRTGGIWRRLRYLGKWRRIQQALTPPQSAEADAAPATRARFAWRKSPFDTARQPVATPPPDVLLEVFGLEFSQPAGPTPPPPVAPPKPASTSPPPEKRTHRKLPIASKSPTQSKPAKAKPPTKTRKP